MQALRTIADHLPAWPQYCRNLLQVLSPLFDPAQNSPLLPSEALIVGHHVALESDFLWGTFFLEVCPAR
jgi:hypothetical protein